MADSDFLTDEAREGDLDYLENEAESDIYVDPAGNELVLKDAEDEPLDYFDFTLADDAVEDEPSDIGDEDPVIDPPDLAPINDNVATLDTNVDVREGDQVAIMLVNGVPTVTGVMGGGDRTRQEVSEARDIAEEAERVARATSQHFWDSDDGVHVTDVSQDEWEEAAAGGFADESDEKPYHNILMNSLGILLRRALKNLVAITKGAIAFYDGQGNTINNIVASFGRDGAQIGANNSQHAVLGASGLSVYNADGSLAKINTVDLEEVQEASAQAKAKATEAEASATQAAASATQAAASASGAEQAAGSASASAATAAASAGTAASQAEAASSSAAQAASAASRASSDAASASASAGDAAASASRAAGDAASAHQAASDALRSVAEVEDVVGVVSWLAEHSKQTEDTTAQEGKAYYSKDAQTGRLTRVDVPEGGNPAQLGLWELDEAVRDYLASHLAQTDAGLNLMVDGADGLRLHLGTVTTGSGAKPLGAYVIDPSGAVIASFGADGAQIGKDSSNHVTISQDGLSIVTAAGEYANVNGVDVQGVKALAETAGNPNLSPFFSRSVSDKYDAATNPDGYWEQISSVYADLEDGWAHVYYVNSRTDANMSVAIRPVPHAFVKPGARYTLVAEIEGSVGTIKSISVRSGSYQLLSYGSSNAFIYDVGDGVYRFDLVAQDDPHASAITSLLRFLVQCGPSSTLDANIRLSLYEGQYEGPYKPYVDDRAIKKAQAAADAAQETANRTKENFWADSTGVHVSTEANKADGEYNSIFTSVGLLFRKGANNLASLAGDAISFFDGLGNEAANVAASFGKNGAQLGASNKSHLVLDFHSIQGIDKEGSSYFHVSDLRDTDGLATITETYTGNGSSTWFRLNLAAVSLVSVKVDDVEVEASLNMEEGETLSYDCVLASAPDDGSSVVILYRSPDQGAKAYTMGRRSGDYDVGPQSVVLGSGEATAPNSVSIGALSSATAYGAHAYGSNSEASGLWSTAIGFGAVAAADGQIALGRYNLIDSDASKVLLLGCGQSPNRRRTIFSVEDSGDATFGDYRFFETMRFLGENPTWGAEYDTREFWCGLGTGYAFITENDQLNGQPKQWGFVISYVQGDDVHQEWWGLPNDHHYRRGGNRTTTDMPEWTKLYSEADTIPLNHGGTGQTGTSQTDSGIITASSGITITSQIYGRWGKLAQLNIKFKSSSAIADGATANIGTVKSGNRPSHLAAGGSSFMAGHIAANGAVQVRNIQGSSLPAESEREVAFTYLLA